MTREEGNMGEAIAHFLMAGALGVVLAVLMILAVFMIGVAVASK